VRQLDELLAGVKISQKEDCGTKNYFEIKVINSDHAKTFVDRYNSNGTLITTAPKVGSVIKIRSPFYCIAQDGICNKCLGESFKKMGLKPGDSLIIASTSIAGPLTDLALKKSHTGTSINQEHVDFKKIIKGL
jgi:hypothetical protein